MPTYQRSVHAEVHWIGAENKQVNLPELAPQTVRFYNKCLLGALSLRVGDYVLIRAEDAAEPDNLHDCDVAEIRHLYELLNCDDEQYRYRAHVQWYARPKAIPHKCFDSDDICIDFDCEVIKDYRPYDANINLSAIFDKCKVFEAPRKKIASQLLNQMPKSNKCAMFVCRYKFVRINRRYQLVPLQQDTAEAATTPKTNRKIEFVDVCNAALDADGENKVSPIKIIGGRSVVRMSLSTAKKQREVIASPLTEKNASETPKSKAALAKRNLNLSLQNDDEEANVSNKSDCLNYSIVKPADSDEIKIKLRVSESRRSKRLASQEQQQQRQDPLALETTTTRKRNGIVANDAALHDIYVSPSKKQKPQSNACTPITGRRKSILKSASSRPADGTPRRSICLSNIVEQRLFKQSDIICTTPKRANDGTPKKLSKQMTPKTTVTPKSAAQKMKLIRSGELSPSMEQRLQTPNSKQCKTPLQLARERLHVAAVPKSLPCREKEFDNIYSFLQGKIEDQCGGCMYVSGVPGTGKTATVSGVIRALQSAAQAEQLPDFEFLEINGMRLTEPRQAYVQIYKQLTGKTVSWEHAHALLEKRFTTPAPRRQTTVLMVDELDILCNRRQDVVYNLMDWPTKAAARLVVITIANTMDLPERLLMGKVSSRLGLTRLTFHPYSHKQLQEIVSERMAGSEAFKSDAVQLVARKVAAVSGDARRALDICRRATEIADNSSNSNKSAGKQCVNMLHVQQALSEMIASPKVQAIKHCSKLEQLFLQAVSAEITRTGVEETNFKGVYAQLESIAAFMGINVPNTGRAINICCKLGSQRLLICEHSRNDIFQKILLNVSADDIHYALKINNTNDDA